MAEVDTQSSSFKEEQWWPLLGGVPRGEREVPREEREVPREERDERQ